MGIDHRRFGSWDPDAGQGSRDYRPALPKEVEATFPRLSVVIPEPVACLDQRGEKLLLCDAIETVGELRTDLPPRDIGIARVENRVVEIKDDRLRERRTALV